MADKVVTGMEAGVRRLLIVYVVSGLLFGLVAGGGFYLAKYEESLAVTPGLLADVKAGLSKVAAADSDISNTINKAKSLLPAEYFAKSPEETLLLKLDDLKLRLKGAEVSAAGFQYQGAEVDMPVTIKGPVKDYTDFVSRVARLRNMRFPFFRIDHIDLKQSGGGVDFAISGLLRTPARPG